MRKLFLFFFLFASYNGHAQALLNGLENLFTEPESYIARYTQTAPLIDGIITENSWEKAPWSENFKDIEGSKQPVPAFQTRMKMLWNDTCLFIAAELQEPHIWAMLRNHDDIVFHDNDFEVFIDPDNNTHQYYEIEVNALNTIFDLFMPKPYRNLSGAMINWDLAKLRSGINIKGTLNEATDKDSSWTVEMAIPFRSVLMGNVTGTPREGEIWRINFSRVEWDTEIRDGKYIKKKDPSGRNKPEHNWVWSPQGVINMHFPERWGYLQFTRKESDAAVVFELPYPEKQKKYLWLCYYRQKEYFTKNRRYASSLKDLGIDTPGVTIDNRTNTLQMEATSQQFMATIAEDTVNLISINDEGLIRGLRNR
ncbi:MAG: carbohydrate-binding family 9-like protein [Chitinophagaceae bacterium]